MDIKHTNLLDLRKSERKRLAALMSVGKESEVTALWESIEATLSRFLLLTQENEEQIYFFGLAMREVVASLSDKSIRFRQHSNHEIELVFTGGFLGYSLSSTLEILKSDRKKRATQARAETKLVQDIEAVVASIVPPDRP